MKRYFCYVTGTRADFGLMEGPLRRIHAHQQLALSVCVTGMHLSPLHGNTVTEVEHSGLRICCRIPVTLEKADGATMAAALAHTDDFVEGHSVDALNELCRIIANLE